MPNELSDLLNLTQILGFIGMALSIARYQMRTTRQIRGMGVCAAAFYSSHFFLLGAVAGGFLSAIGGIRSALLLNRKLWPYRHYVALCALAASAILTVLFYERWVDALPFCALSFGIWMDVQDRATRARMLGCGMQFFWLLFAVFSGSIGGTIGTSVNLMSNLIGFIRHHYVPYLRTGDKTYLTN